MEVLYRNFEASRVESRKFLKIKLSKELDIFVHYYDIQQFYFFKAFEIVAQESIPLHLRTIIQTIIKSSHLIYTANYLTINGDYGAARVLNRQALEYLLIGKYISLEKAFAERWLLKAEFKAAATLFNRMIKPSAINIQELWNSLCEQAHAKTSSFQIGIMGNEYMDILSTFYVNTILLRCKESLVRIFFNEVSTLGLHPQNFASNLDNECLECRKIIDSSISDSGINVITDYSINWELKPLKNRP